MQTYGTMMCLIPNIASNTCFVDLQCIRYILHVSCNPALLQIVVIQLYSAQILFTQILFTQTYSRSRWQYYGQRFITGNNVILMVSGKYPPYEILLTPSTLNMFQTCHQNLILVQKLVMLINISLEMFYTCSGNLMLLQILVLQTYIQSLKDFLYVFLKHNIATNTSTVDKLFF